MHDFLIQSGARGRPAAYKLLELNEKKGRGRFSPGCGLARRPGEAQLAIRIQSLTRPITARPASQNNVARPMKGNRIT